MPDAKTDPRLNLPQGGENTIFQVTAGVSALRAAPEPDAEMVSQALHGEWVTLHHEVGEFGLVQNHTDGYVGWALMAALSAPALPVTHRVSALRTYIYSAPDLKSAPRYMICAGAKVVASGETAGLVRTPGAPDRPKFLHCERAGWVVADHLVKNTLHGNDPAGFAARYLHTPYLWGGRESLGLDCTGLTQQAYGACGVTLPRDSDMQFAWTGEALSDWRAPGSLQRGDLVFWKGHVGIMLDSETLLHA
ncbi:MAG: NlpC/P60 family protein, partial [Pseudomonadota bacterium]